jgi:hypothetical protein
MSFRELQTQINSTQRESADLLDRIDQLLQLQADLKRNPTGPAGNMFDRELAARIAKAISDAEHKRDELSIQLDWLLRKQAHVQAPAAA